MQGFSRLRWTHQSTAPCGLAPAEDIEGCLALHTASKGPTLAEKSKHEPACLIKTQNLGTIGQGPCPSFMTLLDMQGSEEGYTLITQEQQTAPNGPRLWRRGSPTAAHCAAKPTVCQGQRYESDRFLP